MSFHRGDERILTSRNAIENTVFFCAPALKVFINEFQRIFEKKKTLSAGHEKKKSRYSWKFTRNGFFSDLLITGVLKVHSGVVLP